MSFKFLFGALVFWWQMFYSSQVSAQGNFELQIIITDSAEKFEPVSFETTDERTEHLQFFVTNLHSSGYLEASLDSTKTDSLLLTAYIHEGNFYQWANLRNGNVEEEILNEIGFKKINTENSPLNFSVIQKLEDDLLRWYENNGYPFARVWLDSISINQNKVNAKLFADKKNLITIDSLIIPEDANVSRGFAENYLDMKKGDVYDERKIRDVQKRVRDLPYLRETKPLQVVFIENKARVYLHLQNRQASQFNALIGFLPNSQITGRFVITGELNLNLLNQFGRGEQIKVNWKKLELTSQSLIAKFNYPYLFSTPFGIDLDFELYKKDTLYLDLVRQAALQYLFSGSDYFEAFVNIKSTTLLSVDTAKIKLTHALPNRIDVSSTLYGISYKKSTTDYRFNPSHGFEFYISAAAGTKRVKKNNRILELTDEQDPDFEFASLYDNLKLNSTIFSFKAQIDKYWKLSKFFTLKTALASGYQYNENAFENELSRIGGYGLLRGFDEDALSASWYEVYTTELRFLFGQNSNFYAFNDFGFAQNRSLGTITEIFPFGFGVGMSFETNAGIFSVSYALGGIVDQQPVQFRSAKIHFGYVNYF